MKTEVTLFDNPANVRLLRYALYTVLVLLLAVDHMIEKHGHFHFEDVPYFNAAYGFTACVVVIFISKVLRFFLGRRENYYEDKP